MSSGPTAADQLREGSGQLRRASSWFAARWSLLLAAAIPALLLALQGDIELSLADEGFAWYGAQRVLAGDVPLLDFQAYDIGRYYWYAAWMMLAGDTGILPLRAGSTALSILTMILIALLLRQAPRQPAALTVVALVGLAMLLTPHYKVADSFAAVLLIWGLAGALPASGRRPFWVVGACLGLAATIGINHALYGSIAAVLALLYRHLALRQPVAPGSAAAFAFGFLVGYAPVLLCHAVVPGFSAAFVETILRLFEVGTTNIPLPLPRIGAVWRAESAAQFLPALRYSALAAALWSALVFMLLCAWRLARRPAGVPAPPAVFVAAVLASVPYAHYFWSRMDYVHMVVSWLPLLLAAWTLPAPGLSQGRLVMLAGASVLTGLIAAPDNRLYQILRGTPLVRVSLAGESLRVAPHTAVQLQLVERLVHEHAPPGRAIYVVPHWPGAYALARRRSPAWEIYTLFPARPERQLREIQRLSAADPALVLLQRPSADQRADLGFEQTHGLLFAHVQRCFRRAPPTADAVVFRLEVWLPREGRDVSCRTS